MMKKLNKKLVSICVCLIFTTLMFAKASSIEPTEKPLPVTSKETLRCCSGSISGDFKWDSSGWSATVGFKINFGYSNSGNNTGEGDHVDYSINDDLIDIYLGENATHENYLVMVVPKNLIGKTIEIRDSSIEFKNASCGSPLLNFINLKVMPGKIVLKEKTQFRLINVNPDIKKPRGKLNKAIMSQKAVKKY